MTETLVIVPTFNEIESLEALIGRLRQSAPHADVLIVDDASPDGTGALADRLANEDPGVSVLHRASKDGLGAAYLAGFRHGFEHGYEFFVEIDADGSHDPGEIPRMLELAEDGAELVLGSRWVPGGAVRNWPWLRRAISRIGNAYARWILRSSIRDLTSGFRLFRAGSLSEIDLESISSQGYCFQVELAWRFERDFKRVEEHPITFVERATGRSKMHPGIVIEALVRVTGWGLFARRS